MRNSTKAVIVVVIAYLLMGTIEAMPESQVHYEARMHCKDLSKYRDNWGRLRVSKSKRNACIARFIENRRIQELEDSYKIRNNAAADYLRSITPKKYRDGGDR